LADASFLVLGSLLYFCEIVQSSFVRVVLV
jgi:hypothetical protein